MKLFILLSFYLLLSGCAVSYLVESEQSGSFASNLACPDTFSVSGHSEFNKRFIDNGDMFSRDPQKSEYIQWIQEILNEQGCHPKFLEGKQADLNIHVHEYYQPSDAGQGIGIIAMVTLYLVPLTADYLYRDIVISYKGEQVTHTLNHRLWVGWYFLPVHPLSYLPHDKYLLEEKLKITLDN